MLIAILINMCILIICVYILLINNQYIRILNIPQEKLNPQKSFTMACDPTNCPFGLVTDEDMREECYKQHIGTCGPICRKNIEDGMTVGKYTDNKQQ